MAIPFSKEILNGGIIIQNTSREHVVQLEELQKTIFPSLAEDELIQAKHYLRHLEIFPQGQFVLLDGEKLIGSTTTMRTTFDFRNYQHSFKEMIAGGWLTNHDPQGTWLYGLDMGILPAYRKKGFARRLYAARHDLVKKLFLQGQLMVGIMSGYGQMKNQMDGKQYYDELIAGIRTDPTITPQMRLGFDPVALMPNHVNDPLCGNFGILMKLDASKII